MGIVTQIAGKDIEVSTEFDEFEWQDVKELGAEIVSEALQAGKVFAFVVGSNVNWLQASGYKYFKLEDCKDTFWQEVSAINGDWSMRSVTTIRPGKKFGMMCYSHDTPTGGLRSVRFVNGRELYRMFRQQLGMSRKEIIEEFDGYTYALPYKVSNADIIEAIEYVDSEVIENIMQSARDD